MVQIENGKEKNEVWNYELSGGKMKKDMLMFLSRESKDVFAHEQANNSACSNQCCS